MKCRQKALTFAAAILAGGTLSVSCCAAGMRILVPAEGTAESVLESATESVLESATESVLESAAESVLESSAESVLESTAESMPESVSAIESVPESSAELTDSEYAGTVEACLSEQEEAEDTSQRLVLRFAGDINFDENWATTQYMDAQENGIYDVLSPDLIKVIQDADIFMLNNEFTYSTRGEPIEKTYHFRADPSRVEILQELGVDIVLLANNHVFDYGEDALLDTLDTLTQAGIPYVGAGRTLEEAARPYYFELSGRRIAFVAATEGEQYEASVHTRAAGENLSGVLECYDPERFLEAVREAAEESDFVIASVHWGLEYEEYYRDDQQELAAQLAEAGADAVIGTHPHCLEGVEYIGDTPVFYSLGNFWFNDKDLYTGVAELTLEIPEDPLQPVTLGEVSFLPCTQYGLETTLVTDETEYRSILAYLEGLSRGAVTVTEKGQIISSY